ncbi:MAG: MBL fold metallo-hydrolase [Rhodobacteraceae bacterium]|nr:MBL fold metallo-hydrolase [Paracoccaceae bacterium]
MRVSFHGAAGGVTGSCHLIECAGRRILIDCGLFQGGHEIEEDNAAAFGFDAAAIDTLLLTHAHLDHCGRIPLLVKRGFRGQIIATAATRDLARLVMMDSARLQEEEADRAARHPGRPAHAALYGTLDALAAFDRFGPTATCGTPLVLAPGITATFGNAGHILGSAWIQLALTEGDTRRTILFSGDLGGPGRPLLANPDPAPPSDALVIETTYGDRTHRSLDASVDELYTAITEATRHGGNAVIPTFALDRAQEVLFFLRQGERSGKIPRGLPVYLDSPMAITATEIYESHPEEFRASVTAMFAADREPLSPSGLQLVHDTKGSARLNSVRGAVIMAGSGMCTGGRIRHHLRHNLGHAENAIIFVGYAANGTLARRIIDGARSVRLFGDEVPVRAQLHTINGFSAHADQGDLLAWSATARAATTFLVHGEAAAAQAFAQHLGQTHVVIPALHQSFDLGAALPSGDAPR